MWNKLSMNDRAKYIQLGVANGITSLDEIKEVYNKYAEGGPIKKVGPTYDPETHKWTNYYGKDITGKSYNGEYGTTTYFDTGAVELKTGDTSKFRYADNAKRVYIGGSTNNARQEYFNRDKEFSNAVKEAANKYGISANSLASRIAKEGPIDEAIRNYNNTNGLFQRGNMAGLVWGLDDLGTMINEGTIKVNPKMRENLYTDVEFMNEKGRITYAVDSDNYLDGVELTAAALNYFKNEMKKRFPKANNEQLEQYATAAFNMGLSGATKAIKTGKVKNSYKPFINIKSTGGALTGSTPDDRFISTGNDWRDTILSFVPFNSNWHWNRP